MSVIVIGGGPHPQARIVQIRELPAQQGAEYSESAYEIRDGDVILAKCPKLSHAQALLPLIQSGG